MNIFIGNLSKTVTADDLRRAFAGYGTVVNAIVMKDSASGKPLGCAQVQVEPAVAGKEAIVDLDFAPLKGQPIHTRECVPRDKRDRRARALSYGGTERRRAERRRLKG